MTKISGGKAITLIDGCLFFHVAKFAKPELIFNTSARVRENIKGEGGTLI